MAEGDPDLNATSEEPPRGWRAHRWILAVLVLTALATLPKFGNGFVWDDEEMIVQGTVIHDPANLGAIWRNDAMFAVHGEAYGASVQLDTYRPVTMTTFVVDAALSGTTPFAYHLTNWLAHLGCVTLLYVLGLALLQRPASAAFAAGFVGLHPLLAEAHVWINGRSDVFAGLFGLTGALALLRWLRGGAVVFAVLACAAMTLGMLSKEVLLTALPALVLLAWHEGGSRRALHTLVPLGVAVAAALGLRTAALAGLKASEGGGHVVDALLIVPWLLSDGLGRLLVPTNPTVRVLSEEYAGLGVGHVALGAAVLAGCAVAAWRLASRAPVVGVGLLWAAGALAPAALVASSGWWGFGRYLYVPALGVGLVLAALGGLAVEARPGRGRLVGLVAAAWLGLSGLVLAGVTQDWRDTRSLAMSVVEGNPDVSLGWLGMASFHAEEGQPELALRFAQEAVARSGEDGKASGVLGGALLELGRPADAIPYLEGAIRGQSYRLELAYDLGVAYLDAGRSGDALRVAARGQGQFPARADFFHLEALVLARHDAVASLDATLRALAREPAHSAASALPAAILGSHPQSGAYRAELQRRRGELPPQVEALVRSSAGSPASGSTDAGDLH